MIMTKFYTDDKFGLLIDVHSMADQTMQNLEIEWEAKGSSILNCHIFVIADSQFSIIGGQLESAQC